MALKPEEVYAILKKQIQSGGGTPGPAGVGIQKIEKTGTEGLVDTYTITYTNGQTTTYTVTNGADGEKGDTGDKGEKGEKGEPGQNATDDQVEKAVEKYFETNPPIDNQAILEKYIENCYALRRTGKIYQTKLWKFAANPTSTGEKLLDNSGLVFEPSTDTEEGQDDYLNGQNPLFEWCHVNYIRDDDGAARPIAIEGTDKYKTTGAVDVGAMQMSFWWSWDTSNAEYDLITISDLPHPELGLKPWVECEKADGTVLPWCIGSAYVSGEASDGLLRSQPNLKPARNQSHNNMIKEPDIGVLVPAGTYFNLFSMPSKAARRILRICMLDAPVTIISTKHRCNLMRHTHIFRLLMRRLRTWLWAAMYQ